MPRVHTSTRKKVTLKQPMICRQCREAIEVGQTYYTWKQRVGGTSYLHVTHGFPRPSWLSNAKTAVIEDAIQDAEKTIGEWAPELGDHSTEDLLSALEAVADEAEGVGQEYEESADNMPESLQYGTQAEAMREVASELSDWADNLRSFEPQMDEPDFEAEPERAALEVHEDWVQACRDEATDALSDLPYYQG